MASGHRTRARAEPQWPGGPSGGPIWFLVAICMWQLTVQTDMKRVGDLPGAFPPPLGPYPQRPCHTMAGVCHLATDSGVCCPHRPVIALPGDPGPFLRALRCDALWQGQFQGMRPGLGATPPPVQAGGPRWGRAPRTLPGLPTCLQYPWAPGEGWGAHLGPGAGWQRGGSESGVPVRSFLPGRGPQAERRMPSRTHGSLPTALARHHPPGPLGVLRRVPASGARRLHQARTPWHGELGPRGQRRQVHVSVQQRFRPALPGRVAPGLPLRRAGGPRAEHTSGPRPPDVLGEAGAAPRSDAGSGASRCSRERAWQRLARGMAWGSPAVHGENGLPRGGARGDPDPALAWDTLPEGSLRGRLSVRVALVPTPQGRERRTGVRGGLSVSLVRLKGNWLCKEVFGGGLWPRP